MPSEIFTERFYGALETTRGTPVTTPTHVFNGVGLINPSKGDFSPDENRGELRRKYRQKQSRTGCAWSIAEPGDPNYAPFWFNMAIGVLAASATPAGATDSRLWEFIPTMTADDILTASFIWGLEAQDLVASYCCIDTLNMENAADGTDGLMFNISGGGHFPTDIATPTPPANIAGDILAGINMSVWLDNASNPIGTSEITDRIIRVTHQINTGVTYKYRGAGPNAGKNFTRIGRNPSAVNCVTTITLELEDMTQYDMFAADDYVKLRVRHNGDLIEQTAGPVDWYNYIEVDTYGKLNNPTWGVNENSNRTLQLTVNSLKDATLGADFRVAVQNERDAV